MVDAVVQSLQSKAARRQRGGIRRALQRRSTTAFLMTLPLILLIALLVIYPAFYSIRLATLISRWNALSALAILHSCSNAKHSGWWSGSPAFSRSPL